jgi:hypothetical protein
MFRPDKNGSTRTQRLAAIRERERLDKLSRRVLTQLRGTTSITIKGKEDDLLAAIRKGLSNG